MDLGPLKWPDLLNNANKQRGQRCRTLVEGLEKAMRDVPPALVSCLDGQR